MSKLKTQPELLLCPNIPKPMHGVSPRVVMGQQWWDKTRKESYASTDYHCLACGVHKSKAKAHKWLEGHEVYEIDYKLGLMIYVRTVPLCHYCHNYIHDGRMRSLVSQNKMPHSKLVRVIQHGDAVLSKKGLIRASRAEREEAIINKLIAGEMAEWGDWRMVFDGRTHPPKFKSEAQWRKAVSV